MIKRRLWLKLGVFSTMVITAAGAALVLKTDRAWTGQALSTTGRSVVRGIALAVLDGHLPAHPQSRDEALKAHVSRFEQAIASFPRRVQSEIDDLLTLLSTSVGRMALLGLGEDWSASRVEAVQAGLLSMRDSSLDIKVQAYHALRDLTVGAYHADDSTWPQLRYPGPRSIA